MRTATPFKVVFGRILGAFQGTNDYDVTTDFGRFTGIYHGVSRGAGGVMEGGGLVPGTFVWVAFSEGERFCSIIAPFAPLWPVTDDSPRQPLVYPQVAGFELDKRLTGVLYTQNILGLQNRPTDLAHDLVNGEWCMTSPFGAGIAVELFRAGVRAGAMSGLWCHADTQLTRLLGMDFEFMTLAENEYHRRHGNSMVRSRSRVWYPSEAVTDLQPRSLDITGAIHAGEQRFVAPAAPRGTARPALFHQAVDTNGFATITSASGVIIQRYLGVTAPEESQAPAPTGALLLDQPLDTDLVRNKVVTTPIPPVTPADTTTGMTWAQRALDLVTSQTSVRGRGGFDRLPVQWPNAGQPAGVPVDLTHTTYDSKMWRSAPAAVTIPIDAVEQPKKFYVGRSMFALLPDGSVLVEDASHSQILMSGGNIFLSAPHDIILAPGRNLTVLAGQDVGLRATRHLDLATNEGRVNIKAEAQLALLGGNNGLDGVLVESRGSSLWKPGTGTDQVLGGILLKATTGIYGVASTVALHATSEIALRSESLIQFKASEMTAQLSNGFLIYDIADGTTPAYAFTNSGAIIPTSLLIKGQLEVLDSAFFDGSVLATGSVAAGGSVIGASVGPGGDAGQRAVDKAAEAVRRGTAAALLADAKGAQQAATILNTLVNGKTPLNVTTSDLLGFSFATAKQLRTDVAFSFELPEVRWQAMSRRGGFGGSRVWVEKPVKSPAGDDTLTAATPGYEVWLGTNYQLDNADLYLNISNGTTKPQTDGGEDLPAPVKVALNGNYRIGT